MEVFLICFCALFLLFLSYCMIVSNILTVSEIAVESERLPASFDGYRIVLLTDLHDKNFGRDNRRLIERVKTLSPDVILFGGDMHETLDDRAFCRLIEALSGIAPVYSSEGNHDAYYHLRSDYAGYCKKTEASGMRNLNGRVFLESAAGEKIALTGISYHAYTKDCLSFDEDFFNLLLLHNPFCFDELSQKPDLMLSGHVHGGFVRLPLIGGVFAPGAGVSFLKRVSREFFFPKYTKGVYGDETGRLVVSQGLGLTARFPVRVIPPEIICVTLHRPS